MPLRFTSQTGSNMKDIGYIVGLALILIGMAIGAWCAENAIVQSVFIKEDKYNAAVSNVCNLAMADVWDWEHPGRLHYFPGIPVTNFYPLYTNEFDEVYTNYTLITPRPPTKAEFGAYVNVGWIIHTNGADDGWREYRVSDIQTDFRITLPWANSFKSALQQAGLNINKDVRVVLDE